MPCIYSICILLLRVSFAKKRFKQNSSRLLTTAIYFHPYLEAPTEPEMDEESVPKDAQGERKI